MTLAAMSQEAYELAMPYSWGIVTAMMDNASDGIMDAMMSGNHISMGAMGGMMGDPGGPGMMGGPGSPFGPGGPEGGPGGMMGGPQGVPSGQRSE